ncbi:hypothetical protein ACEPPN_012439 [Leptodophora sp. 'Broadleaf-Isolate-01']
MTSSDSLESVIVIEPLEILSASTKVEVIIAATRTSKHPDCFQSSLKSSDGKINGHLHSEGQMAFIACTTPFDKSNELGAEHRCSCPIEAKVFDGVSLHPDER